MSACERVSIAKQKPISIEVPSRSCEEEEEEDDKEEEEEEDKEDKEE